MSSQDMTSAATETDRRQFLSVIGTVGGTVALSGCVGDDETEESPQSSDDEDSTEEPAVESITVMQDAIATTLDTQNHRAAITTVTLSQAYEPLINRDVETAELVPFLAEDWERVDDTTLRLFLRDDVLFHSGDQMTPEDVAFSINRIVDPDFGGIASPQRDRLGLVENAEVVEDENAVDLFMTGPSAIILDQVAYAGDIIMNEEWVSNRDEDEIAQDINGTGPYMLSEYEEDVELVYERFEDYWRGPADIEEAVFIGSPEPSTRVSSIRAGEVDLATQIPPEDAPSLEEEENLRITGEPAVRQVHTLLNTTKEPFDSHEFRLAMNYAVDVGEIIEEILSGFGTETEQCGLEEFVGYNPDIDPYPYDPERAEELIDESGYTDVELTYHLLTGDTALDVDVAEAVSGYLNELSEVSVETRPRDFGSLLDEIADGDLETSPPMSQTSWGNDSFDAGIWMVALFGPDAVMGSTDDEDIQQSVMEAHDEPDAGTRDEMLQEVNRQIHEHSSWLFLHQTYNIYGVSEEISWEPAITEDIFVYDMGPQ